MKRNLNVVMKDFDGRARVRPMMKYDDAGMPVYNKDTGQQEFSHYEAMTLRVYALDALAGRWRGEESMTYEEMWKRKAVYDKILAGTDEVDLSADEMKMVLDVLSKQGRDPIVIGTIKQVFDTDPGE